MIFLYDQGKSKIFGGGQVGVRFFGHFFSCWPFYVLCFLCPIITGVLKRKTNQNLFLISSSLNLGTKIIPADFLAPVETQNPIADGVHHTVTADDKVQKTITQQFHFISDNLCL